MSNETLNRSNEDRLTRLALDAPTAAAPGAKPEFEELLAWQMGMVDEPRASEVEAHVARDPGVFRQWKAAAESLLEQQELASGSGNVSVAPTAVGMSAGTQSKLVRGRWTRLRQRLSDRPLLAAGSGLAVATAAVMGIAVIPALITTAGSLGDQVGSTIAYLNATGGNLSTGWGGQVSSSKSVTTEEVRQTRGQTALQQGVLFALNELSLTAGDVNSLDLDLADSIEESRRALPVCAEAADPASCNQTEQTMLQLGRWAAGIHIACRIGEPANDQAFWRSQNKTYAALYAAVKQCGSECSLSSPLTSQQKSTQPRAALCNTSDALMSSALGAYGTVAPFKPVSAASPGIESASDSPSSLMEPTLSAQSLTSSVQPEGAASSGTGPNRYALLVSVTDYDVVKPRLVGTVNDLTQMQKVVTDGFQVPEKNVVSLTGDQATSTNMRNAVEDLRSKVKPGDRVIVYVTAHGSNNAVSELEGDDEEDGRDEVILLKDSKQTNSGDWSNVFVDDEFNNAVQAMDGVEVVVLLDTCHSGTATRGGSDPVFGAKSPNAVETKRFARPKPSQRPAAVKHRPGSVIAFSASADRENAYEDREGILEYSELETLPGGVFTRALVSGLTVTSNGYRYADANQDGQTSWKELHDWVTAESKRYCTSDKRKCRIPTPQLEIDRARLTQDVFSPLSASGWLSTSNKLM